MAQDAIIELKGIRVISQDDDGYVIEIESDDFDRACEKKLGLKQSCDRTGLVISPTKTFKGAEYPWWSKFRQAFVFKAIITKA